MVLKKWAKTIMLAAVCLFLLTACGGVAKQTIKHQLNSGGMNITMEIPKDGFRSFEMAKLDKGNSDFKMYDNSLGDLGSSMATVVAGPKYSIIIQQINFDNGYLTRYDTKDITIAGNKGFVIMHTGRTSEKYVSIYIPFEAYNEKTKARAVKMRLATNEAITLERKLSSYQNKAEPALQKAAEESRKLLENKEVLEILNSIKVDLPKR